MARGMAKVLVIGNLGRDPETREVGDSSVTNFSLAATRTWRDKHGEQQERTTWVRCVAWGKVGEIIADNARKGDRLYVEGDMETREYEKDGLTREITEVRLRGDFQFLGGGEQRGAPAAAQAEEDDGLPF